MKTKIYRKTELRILCVFLVFSVFSFCCARKVEYPPEIRELQIAVEKSPKDTSIYKDLIKILYEKEYYKEALEYSQRFLDLDPGVLYGYFYSGICYEKLEEWDRAFEYYRKLCGKFPESSEGYYRLAILCYKKGDYQDSTENMEKAFGIGIPDTPTNIEMMIVLAESYYYNNDLEKAYYILNKVLELDPFNQDALYDFGVWKLREGRYENSIELLEKLISQRPQELYPYLRLGKAYYHSKETNLAERAFWDASRFDSTIEVLAKIVHAEDFGSIYKDVNTSVVKVIEEYHYREGDRYYVRGIIENMGLEVAKWVTVVIRFYDKKSNLIKQEVYKLSPRNLRPEQYAFFQVDIPYSDQIFDVKVEPNWHKRSVSIFLK